MIWAFIVGVVAGWFGIILVAALVAALVGLAGHSRIVAYMEWYMGRNRTRRVAPKSGLDPNFKKRGRFPRRSSR